MINGKKETKLEMLLMAFLETYNKDILNRYLRKKMDIDRYHELSNWLLKKTIIEIDDIMEDEELGNNGGTILNYPDAPDGYQLQVKWGIKKVDK